MATSTTTRTIILAAATIAAALAGGVFVGRVTSAPPPCPERVTLSGAHREPRNAAGKVRYCWPGMQACSCDSDNDCYALEGYVACAAVTTGPRDAGVVPRDVGRPDTGPMDVGTAPVPTPPPAVDAGPLPPPIPSTGLVAFPGAEGWGALATGGRGGRVLVVTNLNTGGPGSLQAALDTPGRRTIVFRVSGVIRDVAHIGYGDVTIAGQTSPGGITVLGIDTTEEPFCDQNFVCAAGARRVSNLVVRFLRSRPVGTWFPDGLRIRYVRNAIFDHISVGNSVDEALEWSYSNDVTVQATLLAETVGAHSNYGGILINYTNPAGGYALDRLSLVRNAMVRLQGRYPEMSRESANAAAGTTMRAEIVNTYWHDMRYFVDVNPTIHSGGTEGSPIHYALQFIGNYARTSTAHRYGMFWLNPQAPGTSVFFSDNRSSRWPALVDARLVWCCSDFNGQAFPMPSWVTATRFAYPTTSALPTSGLRAWMVANVGAFPARRDPMDRRLMGFVASDTLDPRPINQGAGDALTTEAAPAPPVDTDMDGCPDAWETAHGMNPTVQDHNTPWGDRTRLEQYLDELADLRVRQGP